MIVYLSRYARVAWTESTSVWKRSIIFDRIKCIYKEVLLSIDQRPTINHHRIESIFTAAYLTLSENRVFCPLNNNNHVNLSHVEVKNKSNRSNIIVEYHAILPPL